MFHKVETVLRVLAAVGVCAVTATVSPRATAREPEKAVHLEALSWKSSSSLPRGVLGRIAKDYAEHGNPLGCSDLRRCEDLRLEGVAVDLDGDGNPEWLVRDLGFTGSGAELDYVLRRVRGRWELIGRIEGIHLQALGPRRAAGFLELRGTAAGRCVEGPAKAVWTGRRYTERLAGVRSRRC